MCVGQACVWVGQAHLCVGHVLWAMSRVLVRPDSCAHILCLGRGVVRLHPSPLGLCSLCILIPRGVTKSVTYIIIFTTTILYISILLYSLFILFVYFR